MYRLNGDKHLTYTLLRGMHTLLLPFWQEKTISHIILEDNLVRYEEEYTLNQDVMVQLLSNDGLVERVFNCK